MTGVSMMLKALGLDIPPEAIEELNRIVPELPRLVSETIQKNNAVILATRDYVERFLAQLKRIEDKQDRILALLEKQPHGDAERKQLATV
jgi:hypothetical protein